MPIQEGAFNDGQVCRHLGIGLVNFRLALVGEHVDGADPASGVPYAIGGTRLPGLTAVPGAEALF